MEVEIIKSIQSISSPFFDTFFELITLLGEETVYIVLLTMIYWCINKKMGKYMGVSLFLSLTINNLIKDTLKFPRPIGIEGIKSLRVETATGYSFPSGHSQGAATFISSIMLSLKNKLVYIIGSILILLVALSRLYLGVHFPKDVLVGMLLGITISYLIYKMDKITLNKRKIYIILCCVFLISMIFCKSTDYIKACGSFIGFILGNAFEESYVDFEVNINKMKRILRWVVGILLILFIKIVGKSILPVSIISDFVRYFMITFVGIGLYPYIFKKLNF